MLRICSALSLLLITPSFAAVNMVQTGHVGGGGNYVRHAAAAGTHAFVAVDSNLTVLDVTNPKLPAVLVEVALPSAAKAIALANSIAYVAVGEGGILIYDVSNPVSPQLITTHSFNAVYVHWEDDWLYICGGTSGLRILDVTIPSAPQLYSSYTHPDPYISFEDVAVRGYTVYIGATDHFYPDLDAYMFVLDTTTPTTVLRQTFYGGLYGGMRLAVGNRYLFGTAYEGSWIWDLLADPNAPALIKTFSIGGSVNDLTWAGGYLYALSPQGLRIYDVSPPASTVLTQALDYAAGGRGGLAGDRIYHAGGLNGLRILDIDDPAPGNASLQGTWDRMTTATRLLRSGNILYVGGERLWIMDASQPGSPTPLSDVDVTGVQGLARSGNYLYAGGATEMAVVDISNPGSPLVVNQIPGRIMDLEVNGGLLYALEPGGLRQYDLTEPANPTPRSFLAQGGRRHLAVHGSYVYLSSPNWDFVTINDFSNPDNPVYVANAWFKAYQMKAAGGRLYSASAESGFQVYDLADPLTPALLGGIPFANSRALHLDGNRAGVGDIWNGVSVVDVTDPSYPVVIASHEPDPGIQLGGVLLWNSQVYTAAHFNGLYVYDLVGTAGIGEPSIPVPFALAATPNPFSSHTTLSFSGASAGPAWFRIHDLGGRLIREIDLSLSSGSDRFTWDGCDHAGRRVPAGLYFARLVTQDGTAMERITVVR